MKINMKPTITMSLEEYNSLKEVQKFNDAEENVIKITICKNSSEHKEYKLVTESEAIIMMQKEMLEMQKYISELEKERFKYLLHNKKGYFSF